MRKLLLILAFIPAILPAQSRKERKALEAQHKADQVVIANLKNHVQNLVKNETSEIIVLEYITSQFQSIGLQPKGTNGYLQNYAIEDGKKVAAASFLKVNEQLLELNKDYFPLPYSAEKKVSGMPAMALRERGVPWFIDLKEWLEDGTKATGNNIEEVIKREISRVAGKGASALFLYNSGSVSDNLRYNRKDKSSSFPIPVIYLTQEGYKKYFTDHSAVLDIELNVAFKESNIKGSNVVGYLDNKAPSTIVIAGHYNSFTPAVKELPEGTLKGVVGRADDNASGIALLIELAKMLSVSKAKSNNYLFIALGGSDKGSTASNYWLNNSTVTSPINYAVNLDMVGSYNVGTKMLVQGIYTSPLWKEVFNAALDKQAEVNIESLSSTDNINTFYKNGIPLLSFSSGNHSDYTATRDEENKLNYSGTLQIGKIITRIIETTDNKGKVAFMPVNYENKPEVKTPEQPAAENALNIGATAQQIAKTTVSLGLIPDMARNESGLKISGVSPKKLASKLGLQPGDVLTELGSHKISDFSSYMKALSNFKTGDRTTLRIKRGNNDKEFAVEF